jgi:arsenate reductase (glutaredoxin)
MAIALTIYHHPKCSKSRKTLELIRAHGIEPKIVEYLEEPPAPATTLHLAKLLGVGVADLLRTADGHAMDETLSRNDDALALWLHEHPSALQRPIVVDEANARACLGRPPESVLKLLKS